MMKYPVHQPAFGLRLKQLRRERKMSQRLLAGDSMTSSYISLLEAGARVPRPDVVHHLAETLQVEVEELLSTQPAETAQATAQATARTGPVRRPERPAPAAGSTAGSTAEPALQPLAEKIAQALAGDSGARRQLLEQAYEAARQGGDPRAILLVGMALQAQYHVEGNLQQALRVLSDCELTAVQAADTEARIRVGIEAAILFRKLGQFESALHQAATADRLVAGSSLEGTLEHVKLLAVQLSVRMELGFTTGVEELVDRMITLAEGLGDAPTTGRAHWAAGMAMSRCGHHEAAAEHILSARSMVASPDTPLADWARFLRDAAETLVATPSHRDLAKQFLAEARLATSMLQDTTSDARITAVTARLALDEGDPRRSLELAAQVREQLHGSEAVGVALTIGRAQFALGRVPDGTATLREAAELATSMGSHVIASQIWRELANLQA